MTILAHDLLQRAYHWIKDAPAGGHSYGCRGTTHLPVEKREPCNCGRDLLLDEIAKEAFAPVDSHTNGHAQ